MIRSLLLLVTGLFATELAAQLPTPPAGYMPAFQDVEIRRLDGLPLSYRGQFKPDKGQLIEVRARYTAPSNYRLDLANFDPSLAYQNESGKSVPATLLKKVNQGQLTGGLTQPMRGRTTEQGDVFDFRGVFLVHAANPTNAVALKLRYRVDKTLDIPQQTVRFTPDWPGDTKGQVLALARRDSLKLGRQTIRNTHGGFLVVTAKVRDIRPRPLYDGSQFGHHFSLKLDGVRAPIIHFGDVDGTITEKPNEIRWHEGTGAWTFFVKDRGDQLPETITLSYGGNEFATQSVRNLPELHRDPDSPWTPEVDQFENRLAELEEQWTREKKLAANSDEVADLKTTFQQEKTAEATSLVRALHGLVATPPQGIGPGGVRSIERAIANTQAWIIEQDTEPIPVEPEIRPGLKSFLGTTLNKPDQLVDLGPSKTPLPPGTVAGSPNFVTAPGPNPWVATLPFAQDKPFSVMLRTRVTSGAAVQGQVLQLGGLSVGWQHVPAPTPSSPGTAVFGKTNWVVSIQQPNGASNAAVKTLTYGNNADLFLTYDGFELMMYTVGEPVNLEGMPPRFRTIVGMASFKPVGERAEARILGRLPVLTPTQVASTISLNANQRFEFGHLAIWDRVLAPYEMEVLMATKSSIAPRSSPSFPDVLPAKTGGPKVLPALSVMEVPVGPPDAEHPPMLRPRTGHQFLWAKVRRETGRPPNDARVMGAWDETGNFHRVLARMDPASPWFKIGPAFNPNRTGEEFDGLIEIPLGTKRVELLIRPHQNLQYRKATRLEVIVPKLTDFTPTLNEEMKFEILSLGRTREITRTPSPTSTIQPSKRWPQAGNPVPIKQTLRSPEALIVNGAVRLSMDQTDWPEIVMGVVELRVDGQLAKPIRDHELMISRGAGNAQSAVTGKPTKKIEKWVRVAWLLPKEGKRLELQFLGNTLHTMPMADLVIEEEASP